MAEKKITKRQNFEGIMQFLADNGKTAWAEVMAHEIDLIDRKSSKPNKETPAQKDKAEVTELIKDVLASCTDEVGMTVTAILATDAIASYVRHDGSKVNSQLVTNILTALGEPTEKYPDRTNEVKRTVVKKVAHYALNYGVIEG